MNAWGSVCNKICDGVTALLSSIQKLKFGDSPAGEKHSPLLAVRAINSFAVEKPPVH
jgi:hypothetical protein